MTIRGHGARRALRRFLDNQRGTVATLTALAIVPIIICVGIGIDYSRTLSAKANLQDSLDAAALALAQLPAGTPQATLDAKAKTWLTVNLHNKDIQGTTPTVVPSNGQIVVSASANVPTTLAAILGVKQLPVSASTTVKWGSKLEVALVLDNTGSMAGNKLDSLVSAAKTLVDTLLAANATAPDSVKISIVPFSNTVNVGASHQGESWIDPTAAAYRGLASSDLFNDNKHNGAWVDRFDLLDNLNQTWGGCVETRPMWVSGVKKDFDVLDTAFSDADPGTKIVPYFSPDGPDPTTNSWGWTVNSPYGNNYLKDKISTPNPSEIDKLQYSAKYDKPKWQGGGGGPNDGCGIQPLQPLSTDATTLKALLGKMVASGNTNVPFGLFWGWMTLSPNTPFTASAYKQPVAYGTADVTKVVIVLTDGDNTSTDNAYSGVGYTWQSLITTTSGNSTDLASAAAMNDREKAICANMKLKNIVIYAVPLEVTNATAKSLLQGCVSADSNYVDVTDSSKLADAFKGIAESISKLRLAK
jgi:Flp pilus assembly protein TadG